MWHTSNELKWGYYLPVLDFVTLIENKNLDNYLSDRRLKRRILVMRIMSEIYNANLINVVKSNTCGSLLTYRKNISDTWY
jgi:hypothetical protein